jgi:predicted sulfurtransferase
MSYAGVHLEPKDYHLKMMQQDTVIIDVRNHYEANIGKFQPPETGAKYIDPNMRKSTEFPLWLDKPETKEQLRGKTVLMYCTGGVRCERASALLKQKMDLEDDVKELGIKEVYQLQGGIDKYFKEFPQGGLWKGKNYVFDKRFAHAPLAIESMERQKQNPATEVEGQDLSSEEQLEINDKVTVEVMGNCEACSKPWDRYRGNRRCPTCGVPSLICRDCYVADANNVKKLGKSVRCDLCVQENIVSKRQLREREEKEMEEYEKKLRKLYNFEVLSPKDKTHRNRTPANKTRSNDDNTSSKKERIRSTQPAPNPDNVTRLFVKNLCVQTVDQEKLCSLIPGITHIKWLTDKESKEWYGSVFLEVDTAANAALAVGTKKWTRTKW